MQLSDSFFPTGMYATSSGLEALRFSGGVRTPREFGAVADAYLRAQVGQADCVALGNAFRAAESSDLRRVGAVDEMLYSMKLAAETREASVRMGRQLLGSVGFVKGRLLERYRRAVERGRARGTQPVVLGVVAAAMGIEMEDAAFILLYSSLVAFVGAAVRLAVIDHNEGQRTIHSSKPAIVELAKNARRAPGAMRQFFPVLEMAQMEHERMDGRMFVT